MQAQAEESPGYAGQFFCILKEDILKQAVSKSKF
jgi:hypothetical protein